MSESTLKAKIREFGEAIMEIADGLEDEGDRCYLGSTNDADTIRRLSQIYQAWMWEQNQGKVDEDR